MKNEPIPFPFQTGLPDGESHPLGEQRIAKLEQALVTPNADGSYHSEFGAHGVLAQWQRGRKADRAPFRRPSGAYGWIRFFRSGWIDGGYREVPLTRAEAVLETLLDDTERAERQRAEATVRCAICQQETDATDVFLRWFSFPYRRRAPGAVRSVRGDPHETRRAWLCEGCQQAIVRGRVTRNPG